MHNRTATANRKRTLYVSDLDGTLLNSNSTISPTSANILSGLINDRGAMFTVATARTPATVVPLLAGIGTTLPFIVMAGAAMWDNEKKCYLNTRPIPAETVAGICTVCERHGISPFVYRRHGNRLQVHHYGEMTPQEKAFVDERLHLPLKQFILDDAGYKENPDEALLIYSMNDFNVLDKVCDTVRNEVDCTSICYHDIFGPATGIMETYCAGSSKASAIKCLAKEVNAERIVVFGDNLNDIPMMRIADRSIAVANAVDEVKAAAHEIIGTNDCDSVARWIEKDVAV